MRVEEEEDKEAETYKRALFRPYLFIILDSLSLHFSLGTTWVYLLYFVSISLTTDRERSETVAQ